MSGQPLTPDRLAALAAAMVRGARKNDIVRSIAEGHAWDAISEQLAGVDTDDVEIDIVVEDTGGDDGISDDEFLDEFV